MILWRVSNHSTLDGSGGLSAAGRWHTAGRRIVYRLLSWNPWLEVLLRGVDTLRERVAGVVHYPLRC